MQITNQTLEGALIAASQELGCSVVDLRYEVLSSPSKGIFGLFARQAKIKILNADEFTAAPASEAAEASEPARFCDAAPQCKIAKASKLAIEQAELDKCAEQIAALLSLITPCSARCSQLESGTLSIEIFCEDAASLLGKENFKYSSLDMLLNHYTNIIFGEHARVDVNGCLESIAQELIAELAALDEQIQQYSRANTQPLSPTLLNIAYEYFLQNYSHKIINIKDGANGRYICVWGKYDEHHRASCKRKH